ncbi:hypothetical protein EK21DRAFT_51367 [Setomelanomma holmii]|uniref:Uncharacterized protein n=1 Tax=Setomelanomma holmii TaxID=210430 RepID=A0A9P4HM08_9PLEO|nr:hypothetical protein EK21DRAFT_51367 [Setomelanomma holmii]
MTNIANTPQVDRVRDTMSFSNILVPSAAGFSSDVTATAPVLAPPVTSCKTEAPLKEEEAGSQDTVMEETAVAEDTDDTAEANAEDVPDDEREFICKNDETSRCLAGQYTKDLSRKVISDHFGRNKACTRDITDWPLFCRKHYQRATYNKKLWQIRKLNLIHRQFDVIEDQFAGTTYDIHFKKSEEARLNEYSRKVASGWSEEEAAKLVAPSTGKHFEAPINILRELDLDLGKNKSIVEVKEIVEKILEQVTDGETEQVPSIEFLPNLPGKITSPKKAPKTPSPKKSRAVKTPSSKGTPGRVSAKGSVKKPSHKD